MSRFLFALGLLFAGSVAADSPESPELASPESASPGYVSPEQAELAKLRGYVSEVSKSVLALQEQLQASEKRNQIQTEIIERLEALLAHQRVTDAQRQARIREAFFQQLGEQLSLSPVYQVERDRVIVFVDPVFIFRKAEIGAEGEARLQNLLAAMKRVAAEFPDSLSWCLQVQGHSDSRPPRGDAEFPSNWELSAARAVALLQLMRSTGFEDQQVYASGFAASRLLASGDSKADHRRNRRIEIHLDLSKND